MLTTADVLVVALMPKHHTHRIDAVRLDHEQVHRIQQHQVEQILRGQVVRFEHHRAVLNHGPSLQRLGRNIPTAVCEMKTELERKVMRLAVLLHTPAVHIVHQPQHHPFADILAGLADDTSFVGHQQIPPAVFLSHYLFNREVYRLWVNQYVRVNDHRHFAIVCRTFHSRHLLRHHAYHSHRIKRLDLGKDVLHPIRQRIELVNPRVDVTLERERVVVLTSSRSELKCPVALMQRTDDHVLKVHIVRNRDLLEVLANVFKLSFCLIR